MPIAPVILQTRNPVPVDPYPPGSGAAAGQYDVESSAFGAKPDTYYAVDLLVPTGPAVKPTVTAQGCLTGTGTGTFTWSSAASFPSASGVPLAIENEVVIATLNGTTTVTVTQRGAQGTVAVPHNNGVSVSECFTSAAAPLLPSDVGATVVIMHVADSSGQDLHTTITQVLSPSAFTVANRSTRTAGLYPTNYWWLSRYGPQRAAIQLAINAAAAAGGGVVLCKNAGYLLDGALILKQGVQLIGSGINTTMLHLGVNANSPIVSRDVTPGQTADGESIRDIHLDGARDRQGSPTVTVTLQAGAAGYTAGASFVDVLSAAALLQGGGVLAIQTASGINKVTYGDIQFGAGVAGSDRITQLTGGQEGTTDANSNNASVTQIKAVGVYLGSNPTNAGSANQQYYDPHTLLFNVHVKNTQGDMVQVWGQSEVRLINVWCELNNEIGFRPSYDTWMSSCTAENTGRMGYYVRGSSCVGSDCKSFFAGGVVASDGWGIFFDGPAGLEAGCKSMTSFNAQDNKAGGARLRNCQRITLTIEADSNSQGSAGTYSAVQIEGPGSAGSTNNIVIITSTDRNTTATQAHALKVVDAKCASNQFYITHGPGTTGQSGFGTAIDPASILDGGNTIVVNGNGGQLVNTFSATPTPDPYAGGTQILPVTANVTAVNAPSNGHHGCRLRLIFQATGAFTISGFNAVYKGQATGSPAYTMANGQTLTLDYEQDNSGNWQLCATRGPN